MPTDAELIQIVDGAVADAVRKSEGWLACRKGCAHCCIGPFAITERDAQRLRVGYSLAGEEQQQRMAARSQEARATMRDGFPGDWESGLVSGQREADAFDDVHGWLPCPILELETGACSLHAWRPVACRLHGPAIRVGEVDLRHCRLNYVGATAEQVESCRVAVPEATVAESPLTYIAWAIKG